MKKLTKAMVEALELLHVDDRQTTRQARHGYVGGQTMAALVRRGLAKALPETLAGERFYHLTLRGLSEVLSINVQKMADRIARDLFQGRQSDLELRLRGLLAQVRAAGL
jgi:hypothetical protein